jgi:hypothetical protein
MIKRILVVIIMLGSFNVSAQYDDWSTGEIYLKDGTTLKGLVRFPYIQKDMLFSGKEKLRYKTERNKPSKKIAAKDIDKVLLNITYSKKVKGKRIKKEREAIFISISRNKKNSKFGFAELVIDGSVKLVRRAVFNSSGQRMETLTESLFVRDDDMAIPFNYAELKSFKKRAKAYFEDCPELVYKIENETFKRKDLVEIAVFYNSNCNKLKQPLQ